MKNVFFKPWVGTNYHSGVDGSKIMIVGASHYCTAKNENCSDCKTQCPHISDLTINVISDDVISRESVSYKKTFVCFERAIYNRPLEEDEREHFWQSVIFYNFCQEPVAGWKINPTKQMILSSIPAFLEVLDKYEPDCVIFWGKVVSDIIINENGNIPGLKKFESISFVDKIGGDLWNLTYSNGRNALICQIRHPSIGFSWRNWHDYLRFALNKSIENGKRRIC